jgi:hypothetical protein
MTPTAGRKCIPQQNGEHGRESNASHGRVDDVAEQAGCLNIICACALWGARRVICALLGGAYKLVPALIRVVNKTARALWGGV